MSVPEGSQSLGHSRDFADVMAKIAYSLGIISPDAEMSNSPAT